MGMGADDSRASATNAAFMARWPTGAKLLVILSIALLPLAVIAVFATLRITQIADTEARAGLRVAAAESSRAIAIELIGDMTALRVAVDALEEDARDTPSCTPRDRKSTRLTPVTRPSRMPSSA